jgi:hypothetical protein
MKKKEEYQRVDFGQEEDEDDEDDEDEMSIKPSKKKGEVIESQKKPSPKTQINNDELIILSRAALERAYTLLSELEVRLK